MPGPPGDADLVALVGGDPLVVLLDVDGTLAPIARRPQDARVPEATSATIRRLVAHPGVHVALVSGRAAADALRLVGVDGVWAIGNHGVERVTPGGEVEISDGVAAYEAALARAARDLAERLGGVPGALVEDKRWSLSVHHRLVDRASVPAVTEAVHDAARRDGLRVATGKEVLEIRAPVDVDKGAAVLALLDRLGGRAAAARAVFIGDDATDEDAFRRLADHVPAAVTVRVGPPDVRTAARFVVDDPAAVRQLLERLAALRG